MSWAGRRRLIVLLIVVATIGAFTAVVLIATFYKTPTCTDSRQNQDEAGVDCGGSCTYLCTSQAQPPTILFTKALTNNDGRTDILAFVVNKNAAAAAKGVPYSISVYGTEQVLIQTVTGIIDLPPGVTVPVYVPGVLSGRIVTDAFLTINVSDPKWVAMASDPRTVPRVASVVRGGTEGAPRVEASIENSSVAPIINTSAVAVVKDARGEVIAASQTLLPSIPAQGRARAIFTWNEAFSAEPAAIEVLPIIPLP